MSFGVKTCHTSDTSEMQHSHKLRVFADKKFVIPFLFSLKVNTAPTFYILIRKSEFPRKIEHNLKLAVIELATRLMIKGKGIIYFGYPAYSHHGRFPPWWVFVRDDYGGNLSGDKIPP